jgi:GlpG protein
MRQLVTLPDDAAQKLADHLLTLDIQTQLQREGDGTAVWVCDEDRLGQARQELEAFQRNPSDSRYRQASSTADQIRREEERDETNYRRQMQYAADKVAQAGRGAVRPVTFALMALAVLATLITQWGNSEIVLTKELWISSRPADGFRLSQVASGEVWRLVTPIFLHYGFMHLFFNLLWLLSLGGQIESLRGSWRLLLLVLVLAILSNLTQFYLGHPRYVAGRLLLFPSLNFGGLSGVVSGLFGYIWVKSRREPSLGFYLSTQTVVMMLGWIFLCVFFLTNIANGAHLGGLAAGVLLGFIPTRRRD